MAPLPAVRARLRDDRGSEWIQAAIVTPLLLVLVCMAIAAGRIVTSGSTIDAQARYAAGTKAILDSYFSGRLDYKPEDLANGAADLLEEVQSNKITGEEEAFSHYDLVDFSGNVEGAQQAFAFLEPGMQKIDADLTKQVNAQFENVLKLLETYRDPNALGGYKRYTAELKASDANKLSKAIQALQEPLSRIAEKVATAH